MKTDSTVSLISTNYRDCYHLSQSQCSYRLQFFNNFTEVIALHHSLSMLKIYWSWWNTLQIVIEIDTRLTELFNFSLQNGIVATYFMEQSHITLIHKGGATDDPSSYTHVDLFLLSLLLQKSLEKIVFIHVY